VRTLCIDQGKYRSRELQELISADEKISFIVPDAAIMEMCKSAQWEGTVRRSLKVLSDAPDRVFVTRGNGQNLSAELSLKRPLTLSDLLLPDATLWLRALLREVALETRGDIFKTLEEQVHESNARMKVGHLNHQENLTQLHSLVPTLKEAYSQEFIKRLRSGRVANDEYLAVISGMTAHIVSKISADINLSEGEAAILVEQKSYIARHFWLRIRSITDWLARGGYERVSAINVTNDDVDRHYVAIGSYCDGILSSDKNVIELDRDLRRVLHSDTLWLSDI
jgi:hypothetical protein